MRILGIDTATPGLALGVVEDGHVAAGVCVPPEGGHGPRLLAEIDSFLGGLGLKLAAMDAFAVGVGPGMFTGLRIGIATVQGFALATGKPIVPVPTLQALAWGAAPVSSDWTICAALDARRGEVYWAPFRSHAGADRPPEALGPEAVERPSAVLEKLHGPVLFLGEGAVRHKELILRLRPDQTEFAPASAAFPGGGAVALLGWIGLSDLPAGSPPAVIVPRYVRPPAAVDWTGARSEDAPPEDFPAD